MALRASPRSTPQGRNFVDDVGVGDLWYFPGGIPHSIQGLGPDGCEFLLVFDDGDFDEDNTFLLSDWFKHVPPEVLGKNFGVPASLFGHTPDPSELYIFKAPVPGPLGSDKLMGAHAVPQSFSHRMMAQEPIRTKSGTVRITEFKRVSRPPRPSRRLSSRSSPADCGSCTGIPTPTNGSTTSAVRRAWACSLLRPGADLRFPGRRRRLRALRHGPLRREHRHDDATFPGDVQEQLLRRCVTESVDGLDPAGTPEGASESGPAGHECSEESKGPGPSGIADAVPAGGPSQGWRRSVRSTALVRILVGVVVERRKARSPWLDFLWRPISVLVGTPSARPWTQIGEEGDATTFYAGETTIELHRTETANYRQNLSSGMPALWVVCDR